LNQQKTILKIFWLVVEYEMDVRDLCPIWKDSAICEGNLKKLKSTFKKASKRRKSNRERRGEWLAAKRGGVPHTKIEVQEILGKVFPPEKRLMNEGKVLAKKKKKSGPRRVRKRGSSLKFPGQRKLGAGLF